MLPGVGLPLEGQFVAPVDGVHQLGTSATPVTEQAGSVVLQDWHIAKYENNHHRESRGCMTAMGIQKNASRLRKNVSHARDVLVSRETVLQACNVFFVVT